MFVRKYRKRSCFSYYSYGSVVFLWNYETSLGIRLKSSVPDCWFKYICILQSHCLDPTTTSCRCVWIKKWIQLQNFPQKLHQVLKRALINATRPRMLKWRSKFIRGWLELLKKSIIRIAVSVDLSSLGILYQKVYPNWRKVRRNLQNYLMIISKVPYHQNFSTSHAAILLMW